MNESLRTTKHIGSAHTHVPFSRHHARPEQYRLFEDRSFFIASSIFTRLAPFAPSRLLNFAKVGAPAGSRTRFSCLGSINHDR